VFFVFIVLQGEALQSEVTVSKEAFEAMNVIMTWSFKQGNLVYTNSERIHAERSGVADGGGKEATQPPGKLNVKTGPL